jgi:hypothetical protein
MNARLGFVKLASSPRAFRAEGTSLAHLAHGRRNHSHCRTLVGALPFSVKIRLATPILFALLVPNNTYISVDCLYPLVVLLNHYSTLVGALPFSVKICLATPILFALVLLEIRRSVSRAGSR